MFFAYLPLVPSRQSPSRTARRRAFRADDGKDGDDDKGGDDGKDSEDGENGTKGRKRTASNTLCFFCCVSA